MRTSDKNVIQVGENYRIKPDQHCWILEIRSEGKSRKGDPKDSWKPLYYPTFEKIAAKIIDEEIKTKESLADILKMLEESKESLARAIKKIEDPSK